MALNIPSPIAYHSQTRPVLPLRSLYRGVLTRYCCPPRTNCVSAPLSTPSFGPVVVGLFIIPDMRLNPRVALPSAPIHPSWTASLAPLRVRSASYLVQPAHLTSHWPRSLAWWRLRPLCGVQAQLREAHQVVHILIRAGQCPQPTHCGLELRILTGNEAIKVPICFICGELVVEVPDGGNGGTAQEITRDAAARLMALSPVSCRNLNTGSFSISA